MKTKISTCIIFLMFGISLNATIWRVNNTPGVNADFSDLQVAIDAASAGDTLYVEGSVYPNRREDGYITIEKQLILLGPGYFLDGVNSAVVESSLNIYPSANGTVIQGLTLWSIYVAADNVTIKRNRINAMLQLNGYVNRHSYSSKEASVSNLTISQNLFQGNNSSIYQGLGSLKLTNALISNNILDGLNTCIDIPYSQSLIIVNNTVLGVKATMNGFEVKSIVVKNAIIQNNYCSGGIYMGYGYDNQYVSANNSVLNNVDVVSTDLRDYFTGGINDSYYQLKSNSLGKNAGSDGKDCGAFGGSNPYVLSGLPPIPRIWDISAPVSGSSNTGLPVTIKIKTQN